MSSAKRKAMSAHRGYAKYAHGYAMHAKPELKFIDSGGAGVSIAGTGTIVDASAMLTIVQDSSESGRVGRKVCLKSIHIQGTIDTSSSTVSAEDKAQGYVRLVLLTDHQTNGTAATFADIYENTDINTFRKLENSKRFTVLKEKVVKLSAPVFYNGAASEACAASQRFKINVKCNMEIDYNAATGLIGTRTQNNLVLAAVKYGAVTPTISYDARVRYYDF